MLNTTEIQERLRGLLRDLGMDHWTLSVLRDGDESVDMLIIKRGRQDEEKVPGKEVD